MPEAASGEAVSTESRTVYGEGREDAPDSFGIRAPPIISGGTERVVGGWASYEIMRRACSDGTAQNYPERTYVGAEDIVESLLDARKRVGRGGPPKAGAHASGRRTLLGASAERLAEVFKEFEDWTRRPGWWAHSDYIAIPPVSALELRSGSLHGGRGGRLRAVCEDLQVLCDSVRCGRRLAVGGPLGRPRVRNPECRSRSSQKPVSEVAEGVCAVVPLASKLSDCTARRREMEACEEALALRRGALFRGPGRSVRVANGVAVRALEAACGPYVAALEDYQARAAVYFDAVTELLRAALETRPISEHLQP